MRLIDADELKKKAVWIEERGGFSTLSIEIDDIRRAPTIDAVPVIHGEWIYFENYGNLITHKCSLCGQTMTIEIGSDLKNYCSNCGAKMDLQR